MIRFLIANKLKFYLKGLKSFPNLLISLFLIFTAWFYGRMLGLISEEISAGEIGGLSYDTLEAIVLMVICLITILRSVFPNYLPLQQLFPKYYPISDFQRYAASLLNDILKPYFFHLSIFILSGSYFMSEQNINFLLNGILVLIGSHLLRRSIQYLIDFRLKVIGIVCIMPVLVIPILIYENLNTISLLMAASFFGILGFIQEKAIIEVKNVSVNFTPSKFNTEIKLLVNNKKAFTVLLVALIFKTLLMVINHLVYTKKGEYAFNESFIFWLFGTPLIFFTYVFNNIWGYWKNLWFNLALKSDGYRIFILHGLRLFAIPIALDLTITLPFFLLSYPNHGFVILFYLTSTIFLIAFSFFWALMLPIKIANLMQLKGNTSLIANIYSIIFVFCLTSMKVNPWFYLLIPLTLILSGIAIWASFAFFKESKYMVTGKLLK